jgi:hypothetical protein
VKHVYVDVNVTDVTAELAEFIADERDSPRGIHHGLTPDDSEFARLAAEYEQLGKRTMRLALDTYNRFIAFCRTEVGQYWLHERRYNEEALNTLNNGFHAKARSEAFEWVRWCPPGTNVVIINAIIEADGITQDEWTQAQSFVAGNRRPRLTLELLANATLLLREGRRRSAIIEAVSALEIALSRFAEAPLVGRIMAPDIKERISVENLKSQVDHLGLRGSIRYLVPILFPHGVFPTEVLHKCQQAVEVRNAVVHQGQREVEEQHAGALIGAIRLGCSILAEHTHRA